MTYTEYKRAFIERHKKADWTVHTSNMESDGSYHKTYIFTDGAQLIEINRPVFERAEAEIEIKGVKTKIVDQVKLFETEAWNTDDPKSYKWYEKY